MLVWHYICLNRVWELTRMTSHPQRINLLRYQFDLVWYEEFSVVSTVLYRLHRLFVSTVHCFCRARHHNSVHAVLHYSTIGIVDCWCAMTWYFGVLFLSKATESCRSTRIFLTKVRGLRQIGNIKYQKNQQIKCHFIASPQ